uniref:Uncharacterized protein n=1 Tax=Vombatus ursinus TaxID=29139 RepID=A0A4X2JNM5_VOMUR
LFIAALFEVAKSWKLRRCPSIGEWLKKLWYIIMMEYYCVIRNGKLVDFRETWKDLHEIMKSEMNRTKRMLFTIIEGDSSKLKI